MRKKRLIPLLLALALCLGCVAPALAAETARTIQLMKTEGTVTVTNASARSVSIREQMRLYSGYHVATKAASYAWASLDETKLAKLDASGEMELRKSGNKLEVLLNSGNIYFNVTEPLGEDESMNIRTSTMVMGIRGTCGWISRIDPCTTRVTLLHGKVECTVQNPISGQRETVTVTAGQTATLLVRDPGQPGGDCEVIFAGGFGAAPLERIPGFVQVELAKDPALRSEIQAAAQIDLSGLTEETAAARQAADEAAAAEKQTQIDQALAGQDSNVSTEPVWETPGVSDYIPPSYTLTFDANGGSGDVPESVTTSTTYTLPDGAKLIPPAGAAYSFAGWALTPDATVSDVIRTITPSADTTLYAVWGIETTIDLATANTPFDTVQAALNNGNVTLTATNSATFTIDPGAELIIPTGSTLTINSGVTLDVEGSLAGNGSLTNSGTVSVAEGGTATVEGALTNSGTITVDGTLNTLGAVENNGTINVYSSESFHANSITNSGLLIAYESVLEGGSGGDTISYGLIDVQGTVTNTGGIWIQGISRFTCGLLDNTNGWMLRADGALVVNSNDAMTSFTDTCVYIETMPFYVQTVTIGNSITSIPDRAFYYFTNLATVSLGNGVTSIGTSAFDSCTALTSVSIPSSVTEIGDYAFYGSGLSGELTIPYGVTSIGNYAFDSTSLTSASVPTSVTSLDAFAFGQYNVSGTNIKIYYQGTSAQWNSMSFPSSDAYSTAATCVYFKENAAGTTWYNMNSRNYTLTITGSGQMKNYASQSEQPWAGETIHNVVIEDGVTSIGNYAFSDCNELASITIGSGVTSIGTSAFSGCSSLASITIGSGVTSIGTSAFSGCDDLTNIYFTGTVADWNNWALREYFREYFKDKINYVYVGGSPYTIGTDGTLTNAAM